MYLPTLLTGETITTPATMEKKFQDAYLDFQTDITLCKPNKMQYLKIIMTAHFFMTNNI